MESDHSRPSPRYNAHPVSLLLGLAALIMVASACRSTPRAETDERASGAAEPELAHQIDGWMHDWEEPNVVVAETREDIVVGNSDWDGPRDASLRVVSDRDERHIYFAAEVRDEKVIDDGPGRTDGVILWIGDRADIAKGQTGDTVDQFALNAELGATFSPDGEVRAPRAFASATDSLETFYEEGIRAATVSTDRGYRVEVALKLGKIREVGGIPIPDLSFRFQLVDADEPTKPQALTSLITGPILAQSGPDALP